MLGLVRHARACPRLSKITISLWRVELFCLFVACSFTLMKATVLSCCFSWVWFGMPKVLWSNKSPISLESIKWFYWFLQVYSYLHLVRYPLKLQPMLFWAGIVRYSLSANQIVRCYKLKKLKKDMRYQVKLIFCFHWSWKKYHAITGYDSKILLVNQFAGFFYFWLVWHVKLNRGSPSLHCTCFSLKLC